MKDATAGRGPIHNPMGFERVQLPGLKPEVYFEGPDLPRAADRGRHLRRAPNSPGDHRWNYLDERG